MCSIEVLNKDVRNKLSDYRYEHSLRVADVSKKLAYNYHYDENKAYIAGLVHDIAKEFNDEENKKYIDKYNLLEFIDDIPTNRILHGPIGSLYLEENYKLDNDIIKAVRFHTTGDPSMGLLEKIVFVADKIEPNKTYNGIEEERELAYKDIDKCMMLCIENNIKKLTKEKKRVNNKSIEVLNSLKNKY